ncbi:hypothetical protein LTR53_000738 [Teratosphaeriaceae sp. CCFEE 6253]|nr:hypothetical protein LTR53_000738 [Teratosphaeriaceae sp. CCFEE 6253]
MAYVLTFNVTSITTAKSLTAMEVRKELNKILQGRFLPAKKHEQLAELTLGLEAQAQKARMASAGSLGKVRALEADLLTARREFHKRGAEIKERHDQIHDLKNDRAAHVAALQNLRHTVAELRASVRAEKGHAADKSGTSTEQTDEAREEKDTALLLATAFQKRAHEERQQFGAQLQQRKAENVLLHEQIYRLTHAESWDEATGAALEAQASTHLKLVQGLQADLAECDAKLEELSVAKLSGVSEMDGPHITLIAEHQRTVKELEEARAQAQEAANSANIKVEKWKKTAGDQSGLIKKLMAAK